ncbi:MAG: sporulation protein YabP [Bacilli bacterium]|nr:sporulation protein YabP [Bacilli bacterium]
MDKDNSTLNNYNHSISLLERKTLVITGVKKIDNFDKMHFLLDTTMGFLIIKGDNLDLVKLDTLSGNVTIKGNINSLDYILENKKNKEESVFSRLFK